MNSDEGMHMETGSWAVAVAIIGLIGSIWYRYAASKKMLRLREHCMSKSR